MQYEYLFINYVQVRGGYRFYDQWNEEGIITEDSKNILPVLNHYGELGWEFICWDNGRLLFKRNY